ncbi:helix-turn-helix transcriptional regulator [Catenuloplanes indicus]|uniref:AraC-like DNA-binding protein n=1 Tax=Catenuloplanes indicus TaxID=137267 RepID=A0AAE3VZQ3_9ACTN|nr:helix-turn-helix transcriptional regulator [Catenuloplanes indicus]MDQ0366968.1 AraC-like DNA-binding protein [Catenuloplanes indicus]
MATVFETTDIDAVHEFLCRAYGRLRLRATAGEHHVRFGHYPVGAAQLHRNSFRMSLDVDSVPQQALIVGRIAGGRIALRAGGAARVYGTPGEAFVAVQPGEPHRAALDNAHLELAVLDPGLVAEVADGPPGRAARPIRFAAHVPVPARSAWLWDTTYDYVFDCLNATPEAVAEPLVAGSMARLLASTALSVFPHDGLTEPTIEDRRDAHPASLRRAVAFIDDNAHRDISPADIASVAHVSIRAMQMAFRRHLDITPRGYLRRVRLAHAHRDLLAADPRGTTVMAIAARCGFTDHSRFTAHYRAVYGVTPSWTLRRAS